MEFVLKIFGMVVVDFLEIEVWVFFLFLFGFWFWLGFEGDEMKRLFGFGLLWFCFKECGFRGNWD